MKAEDLKANPNNPRKITDERLAQLKKSITEYGDLSGIVFNRTTGQLVCGHQRNKNFDESTEVKITKEFEKATRSGTVAVGFLMHEGERFSYREVEWPRHKEMAANIAANKNAGDWDLVQLKEDFKELADSNFDLDLTMFDNDEILRFSPREILNTTKELDLEGFTRFQHECPKCGFEWTNKE